MKRNLLAILIILVLLIAAACAAQPDASGFLTFCRESTGDTLSLGMTAEEVEEIMGRPDDANESRRWSYHDQGIRITFVDGVVRLIKLGRPLKEPGVWAALGGEFPPMEAELSAQAQLSLVKESLGPHADAYRGLFYYLFDAGGRQTDNIAQARFLLMVDLNYEVPGFTVMEVPRSENKLFSLEHPDTGATIALGMTLEEITGRIGEEPVPLREVWAYGEEENTSSYYGFYGPMVLYQENRIHVTSVAGVVMEIQAYRESPWQTRFGGVAPGDDREETLAAWGEDARQWQRNEETEEIGVYFSGAGKPVADDWMAEVYVSGRLDDGDVMSVSVSYRILFI